MTKAVDGECISCKWFDIDEYTCMNRKGAYYKQKEIRAGDVGCDHYKPCELEKQFEREEREASKPRYGDGLVPNIWDEWQKKAYRKGLYHEN